jgi:hypothetical protein
MAKQESAGLHRRKRGMPAPDLPRPVLFHALKHHVLYIREFIRLQHMADEASLKAALRTIGRSQLDLYLGALSPLQIATETIDYLQEQGALEYDAYRGFISGAGADYRVFTLSDGSDWVLRWGEVAGRHVHLHPARYSRETMRVKANTLKTAIAVNVEIRRDRQQLNLQLINQVRTQWLELAPVPVFLPNSTLAHLVQLLDGS